MSTVTFPDTNVLLRYLLADVEEQYRTVRPFFEDLKRGHRKAVLLPEVLLETFYVLTRTYGVPPGEAAEALKDLLLYRGTVNRDRSMLLEAFDLFLESKGLSLLDCLLCMKAQKQGGKILTFDAGLKRKCPQALDD